MTRRKGDIAKRLRYSVGYDAINGARFERGICASQMLEAADEIDRLRKELEELRLQREQEQ